MSKRKHAKTETVGVPDDVLDELFASGDNRELVSFSESLCVAFGRIIVAAARLGGLATFYYSDPGACFVLSLRIANRKRAYQFVSTDEDVVIFEHIANTLESAVAKQIRLSEAS